MHTAPQPRTSPEAPARPQQIVSLPVVSLLRRADFYVADSPPQRPGESVKEPHRWLPPDLPLPAQSLSDGGDSSMIGPGRDPHIAPLISGPKPCGCGWSMLCRRARRPAGWPILSGAPRSSAGARERPASRSPGWTLACSARSSASPGRRRSSGGSCRAISMILSTPAAAMALAPSRRMARPHDSGLYHTSPGRLQKCVIPVTSESLPACYCLSDR